MSEIPTAPTASQPVQNPTVSAPQWERRLRNTVFIAILLGAVIGGLASRMADHMIGGAPARADGSKGAASGAGETGDTPAGKEQFAHQGETFRNAANVIAPAVVNITTIQKVTQVVYEAVPSERWGFYQRPHLKEGKQIKGIGSGFVLDGEKGYILTNNHVIAGGDEWIVRLRDKRELTAKLIGTDPQTDVAVLQVVADNLTAAKIGNSDEVEVGDWVLAAGSPFGLLEQTITAGIISAKGRHGFGLNKYEDFLQTDAAINEGNSGGPLVDLNGHVIGVNTAILSKTGGYQGIGFSIPINQARKVAEQIIKTGHVVRGWMGIELVNLRPGGNKILEIEEGLGLVVKGVFQTGPCDKAGLKPGDVVIEISGTPLKASTDLSMQIANLEPGAKLPMKYMHQEGTKYVTKDTTVVIEAQPDGWGQK